MKIVVNFFCLQNPSEAIIQLIEALSNNGNDVKIAIYSRENDAENLFRMAQSLALDVSNITSIIYNSGEKLEEIELEYVLKENPMLYITNDLELFRFLKDHGITTFVV